MFCGIYLLHLLVHPDPVGFLLFLREVGVSSFGPKATGPPFTCDLARYGDRIAS